MPLSAHRKGGWEELEGTVWTLLVLLSDRERGKTPSCQLFTIYQIPQPKKKAELDAPLHLSTSRQGKTAKLLIFVKRLQGYRCAHSSSRCAHPSTQRSHLQRAARLRLPGGWAPGAAGSEPESRPGRAARGSPAGSSALT